jgi:hypothetical protein
MCPSGAHRGWTASTHGPALGAFELNSDRTDVGVTGACARAAGSGNSRIRLGTSGFGATAAKSNSISRLLLPLARWLLVRLGEVDARGFKSVEPFSSHN